MRDQKVYLNGTDLESVHPAIMLQHIQDGGVTLNTKATDMAGTPGQWLSANKPQKREIVIEFAIRERLDFTVRADAINAVTAWAMAGGWLELSNRPGLRLWVQATELPSLGKLREWTNSIKMSFTAYAWPFWVEKQPLRASDLAVTTGTLTVSAVGTWETRLEAEIIPDSATLTSAALTAGDETMTLTGLSVAAGKTLAIYWDANHLLHIEADGTGVLGKRTGDDLLIRPGRTTVSMTFNTACGVTMWARGCYL